MARAVVSQGSRKMLYAFGTYELDLRLHELRCAGAVVAMEPRAFQVLVYLVQHRDHAIAKEELMAHLWPGQYVKDWVLVQSVVKARRAIGDTGQGQRGIKTIMGFGYRFIAPVEERTAVQPAGQTRAPLALQPKAPRRAEARRQGLPRMQDGLAVQTLSLADRGQVHSLLEDILTRAEGGQGCVVLLCYAATCPPVAMPRRRAQVSTLPPRRSSSASVPVPSPGVA